ncbi:valine--tRNA ligase, mitochondrial 1-like [Typha latifolia]|uniref:valine--tRNA ligase, mitochondrial 1-like n=1 Tax=Typha latifolia TaxID=4733 RepID=UPI003C2BD85A
MASSLTTENKDVERKMKKEQKAKEKAEKKQKAQQKEAARLQAQEVSDGPKRSEKKHKKKDAENENPRDFLDPFTPDGEKKKLSRQMAKQYQPSSVEKSWYDWWERAGFFSADANSSKPPFVIVLPPPNVTGALHIGHALTAAIQDTIIRWRRMSGYNALWVPGMDHAGIATQVVVEKKLMRESKLTRHDIGRESFMSEVWKWKDQYGGTILTQERRLGASLDWSRECFTMDEKRSKAVTEAFVRLYREGLIYRDNRLVNWDCTLRTAISDIEVESKEIEEEILLKVPGYDTPVKFGVLTSFAYPLEGGSGEIIVATTRIETMLGDTAVAIHSKDERYKHLHGKCAIHPFNGRRLPIICDDKLVDPKFGTGAVKITPAHDADDFEVGRKHRLDFINIFTDDGKINSNGGLFEGMPRFTARVAITEELQAKGLYRGAQKNEMKLGICSRSNDVKEPMIRPQWFLSCGCMKELALDAVESKKIEIIPQQYKQEWDGWVKNIRDWCISRQLWWGHRIPAWYVTLEEDQHQDLGFYNDHWVVARNENEAVLEANQRFSGKNFHISQDPDVLDTWFSSGLFPLSVLGWPDDTADFGAFYPTSVLETGHDILFFWVARMVMLGLKLGGDVPFRKVYLHPMIRDAHGRKMSKSLGNVIDPLEVINGISLEGLHKRLEEGNLDPNEVSIAKEGQKKDFPNGIAECGADALRFALLAYTAQSDKINLDVLRVVGYRQWCNKLWNAVYFSICKLGDQYMPPAIIMRNSMPSVCKWILSVLNKAVAKTILSFESYKFSDATTAVYSWWQFQFCDVFIEAIKPYFYHDSEEYEFSRAACRDVLWTCLDTGLRLLHPFMPFVTEELWQRLPQANQSHRKDSIMITDYPSVVEDWTNEEIECDMETVIGTVRKLRSLRPPGHKNERHPAFALGRGHDVAGIVKSYQIQILTLASISSLKILAEEDTPPVGCAMEVVNENLSVYLQLQGALNAESEREKLTRKREDIQKQYSILARKMNAQGYKERAPKSIQEEDSKKLTSLLEELRIVSKAEEDLDLALDEEK